MNQEKILMSALDMKVMTKCASQMAIGGKVVKIDWDTLDHWERVLVMEASMMLIRECGDQGTCPRSLAQTLMADDLMLVKWDFARMVAVVMVCRMGVWVDYFITGPRMQILS